MWNIFKANRKDTCVSLFISFIYINISNRFYCWLWTYICLLGQHSVESIIAQTEAYNLLVKFLRQARKTFVTVESTGNFTATSYYLYRFLYWKWNLILFLQKSDSFFNSFLRKPSSALESIWKVSKAVTRSSIKSFS